jgi:glycosyltransferase involved in cell wall biosynthesis
VSPRTTSLANRLALGSLQFSAISRSMVEAAPLAGKWHVVPNGVPLEGYAFRGDIEPDAPFVFLGRVEEVKGPHLAIEIAKALGAKLVIAGNVPVEHQSFFEACVEPYIDGEQIQYIGPVDDAEKNALLGGARAFLMPILWEEPFGIVMAEAMACGTPVLGLARGAVPEVVEHGVTGFVADDVAGLIEAAAGLDAIDRRACRARVERMYSDRTIVDAYVDIYGSMAASQGRRQESIARTVEG